MFHTRIRVTGAALLFAACLFTSGPGRSDDKDKQPDPKPTKDQFRKEFETKFAGRTPDEVLTVLNQLAQDLPARKGAYEVAAQRLKAQAAEVTKARQKVDALKEPDAKAPLVLRAADVEAGIKVAQQLADYHNGRVQALEAVKAAHDAFKARQTEFTGAVNAARDHLARMRAAADVALKLKAVDAEKVPSAFADKQLTDAESAVSKALDDSTAATKPVTNLPDIERELTDGQYRSLEAKLHFEELKAKRQAALDAFKFEEDVQKMSPQQLSDEFTRLRKVLAEKTNAIKGDADDYAKSAQPVAEARARLAGVKDPPVPTDEPWANAPTPMEQASRKLLFVQQYLGARVRAADERAEKTAALVAALDEQEKKAVAYSTTLEDARRTAAQLATVAAEIGRRVGRGDLDPAKAPDGLAEASSASSGRGKLDTDIADVQKALGQLRTERDALRKPNPDADTVRSLTAGVLARVTERIDRHADLKKLAADYATPRRERPEVEQRRSDQTAADRMARDAGRWEPLFAIDRSKSSTDISELIAAYYKELIELDEKEENLTKQRAALTALVAATNNESEDIAKLRAVLEKLGAPSDDVKKWDSWLAARVSPVGLKAEAGLYHDEQARIAVVDGANARRVLALTGNPPAEPGKPAPDQAKLPATRGEIGKARDELFDARVRGFTILGIKIGLVLLTVLILPRLAMRVLRRTIRGGSDDAGNPTPVLGAFRRVLKLVAWAVAVAVILNILGFDVTALVVALAIGALALAVAARPMIADVLGSLAVFADRRFKVGDVVRVGGGEPARVVGLTWRSTALRNSNGLVVSVPNRQLTEGAVENMSRGTETFDTLGVTISTDKDAGKVISVIRAAMAQCKNLAPDQGVTVVSYTQRDHIKIVQYRFWWFLKDYEARNKTRDEVFARIAVGLAHEDMTGIEVTLG